MISNAKITIFNENTLLHYGYFAFADWEIEITREEENNSTSTLVPSYCNC